MPGKRLPDISHGRYLNEYFHGDHGMQFNLHGLAWISGNKICWRTSTESVTSERVLTHCLDDANPNENLF
jgi:hypothetical protein